MSTDKIQEEKSFTGFIVNLKKMRETININIPTSGRACHLWQQKAFLSSVGNSVGRQKRLKSE